MNRRFGNTGGLFAQAVPAEDGMPPGVISVSPAVGSRNVPLNSGVRIGFDEPLDSASVNSATVQLRDTRNVAVDGVVSYDAATRVVTFVPSAPLLATRPYSATVLGGGPGPSVRDMAGNALGAIYAWTFVTTVEPTRIAAGTNHSVAVDDAGQVWTWGGAAQQRGQTADARIPGAVPAASGVVAVAAGNSHTLAVKGNGTVLAWGVNTEGQLGINSQTAQSSPVTVVGLTGVIAVAAGATSSVALKSDGTVWTWGSAHQIGDGQNARRLVPVQVPGLADVIGIASGDVAVYALKADGSVWAWGDDTNGQIGDGVGGSGVSRLTPVQLSPLNGIVAIAAGAQHALALAGSDLSVRAWGLNASGQIGDGTTSTQRYLPTAVIGLRDVRSIDAAGNRSLAALLDGTVKVWGAAATSNGASVASPIDVPGNPQGSQVTGNVNHNIAVTAGGSVWTWGLNGISQLGDGTTADRRIAEAISADGYAWKVATPTFNVPTGVYSQAQNVTIASATPGAVIRYTTDAREPTDADRQVPASGVVVVDRTVTLTAAASKPGSPPSSVNSESYTLQVTPPVFSPNAGTFSSPTRVSLSTPTAGAAIHYTLDGATPTVTSPLYSAPLDIGTTTTIKAVAMRDGWSDSAVRAGTFNMNFGALAPPTLGPLPGTYEGQVVVTLTSSPLSTIRYTTNGTSPTASSSIYNGPLVVNATTTIKARAFRQDFTTSAETAGTYTIAAVAPLISRTSGTYSPGTRFAITDSDPAVTIRVTFNGQDPISSDAALPSGTTLMIGNFPVRARGFKAGTASSSVASADFALTEPFGAGAISAGGTHSLLATPGGLLYVWGLGASGQLGLGSNTNRTTPTVVPTLTGVVSISGGAAHTLAGTWDGRLFAWGSNASGRLGDGTTTASSLPVEIPAIQNVVAVAAGGSHSLALTADGRVYAWGSGTTGQLGLGTTGSVLVPTLIPSLTNVVAIAAGSSHSFAVTSAGQLYAWGLNSWSQLGDGGQTTQTTPKLITTVSGVADISAGATHSLARLFDGTVYSWGENTTGQLGLGDTLVRRVPTQVPGLIASSIAAGTNHSLAERNDGVVVAWGANGSGQVGDGTTITPRTRPVVVVGPTQVAKIAAATSHSIAVTTDGHVWTWGSDGSGQLGDGTTTPNRPTPIDVLNAPGSWTLVSPPELSLAPGVYNSVQAVVVSNPLGGDAEMHYTTTGAVPTRDDVAIANGASLTIDRTITVKIRAWNAGGLSSEVVSASYVLQPDAPVIAPAAGAYNRAQAITINSATTGTVVRYTVDGTEPSASSAMYDGSISITTFTVLRAKAFRDGWTPSGTSTATFSFDFGILPAPRITPLSGHYVPGQRVTIFAGAGDQVRFTLDGSDPLPSSMPYISPILLPQGFVTVKARAYNIDWSGSDIVSESFVITDDVTPPTITASFSPAPNAAGWNSGDVTVTFTCDDAGGIKWCTPPTRIGNEGFELPVIGSAVDVWGNHTTTKWTVNIDRTPPDIRIYTPKNGSYLPPGTTSITVRGSVQDVSGIETVLCGNNAATVINNAFVCGVSVAEGSNVIAVQASDRAGHSTTVQVSVSVGIDAVTSLDISPATLLIAAGESREIFVKDQHGSERHDGRWSVSDASIATIVDVDGVITLRALAAGEVTASVVIDGVTASAAITVMDAGATVPSGTTLWSLSDRSVFGPPKRGYVLRASSIQSLEDTNRSPGLFFVDEGTEYFGNGTMLTRGVPNRPTRIRTTTPDGRELSQFSFDGRIPRQIAADNTGGFVLVFPKASGELSAIQRVDGKTGSITWEYVSFSGFLSDVAIHPDGTVYATEKQITGANHLVAVDATGTVARHELPQGHYTKTDQGECGWNDDVSTPGYATAPIILEDGSIVLVTRVRVSTQIVRTHIDPNSLPLGCSEQLWASDYTSHDTKYIVQKPAGSGGLVAHEVSDPSELLPDQFMEDQFYLLPDGVGGLLVAHRQGPYLLHINSEYQVTGSAGSAQLMSNDSTIKYETEYVLGEDGVYALVNSRATTQTFPSYAYAFSASVIRIDPETLAPLNAPMRLGEPTSDPQHLRLKFALAGGGVYANGPWSAYVVNGFNPGFAAGGNASQPTDGNWAGWGQSATVATGAMATVANTEWAMARGTDSGTNASDRRKVGILVKSQNVFGVGRHTSIRFTPHNQNRWIHDPAYGTRFRNFDTETGLFFATLGAGPTPTADSATDCSGNLRLISDLNRDADVAQPAQILEKLRYNIVQEDEIIERLLALGDQNYQDQLFYCFMPTLEPFFNSNSFTSGLLKAASVPLPLFPTTGWTPLPFYPGWSKPVPATEFRKR